MTKKRLYTKVCRRCGKTFEAEGKFCKYCEKCGGGSGNGGRR